MAGPDASEQRWWTGAVFEHHLTSELGPAGRGAASGVVPPALREQADAALSAG